IGGQGVRGGAGPPAADDARGLPQPPRAPPTTFLLIVARNPLGLADASFVFPQGEPVRRPRKRDEPYSGFDAHDLHREIAPGVLSCPIAPGSFVLRSHFPAPAGVSTSPPASCSWPDCSPLCACSATTPPTRRPPASTRPTRDRPTCSAPQALASPRP